MSEIVGKMPEQHKRFLISVKGGQPDRALLDLPEAKDLPAVRWKLENLARLSAEKRVQLLKRLNARNQGIGTFRYECRQLWVKKWSAKMSPSADRLPLPRSALPSWAFDPGHKSRRTEPGVSGPCCGFHFSAALPNLQKHCAIRGIP